MIQQIRRLGADEIRALHERPALGRDAPDAAVNVVAARVAEIDLAVLDDRVVPVGNVDRPVRAHLDVDRPEGRVVRLDDIGHFTRGERAAVVAELEPADAVAAEVVGDAVALPVVGKMSAADDLEAAVLRAAGVEPVQIRGEPMAVTK